MAIKLRGGNNYRIAIGFEPTYNAGGTTAGVGTDPATTEWDKLIILPGVAEMVPVVNTVAPKFKSQSPSPHTHDELRTTSMANVTYSGELDFCHNILVQLFFDQKVPVDEFIFQDDPNATPLSAVMYLIHKDSSAANSYMVDKAQGLKLMKLTTEGSQGSFINITAEFEAAAMAREVTQTITGADPGNPLPAPAQFADMNVTIMDEHYSPHVDASSEYGMESFGLTLTKIIAGDATKFSNNLVPTHHIITGYEGEIRHTALYNAEASAMDTDVTAINNPLKAVVHQINMNKDGGHLSIFANSVCTSIDRPDPDRDIFKLNYVGRLAKSKSIEAENAIYIYIGEWVAS